MSRRRRGTRPLSSPDTPASRHSPSSMEKLVGTYVPNLRYNSSKAEP